MSSKIPHDHNVLEGSDIAAVTAFYTFLSTLDMSVPVHFVSSMASPIFDKRGLKGPFTP